MKKLKSSIIVIFFLPLFAMGNPVVGFQVGNIAPEIIAKNYKDSLIKLSSLRGKVVLIEFWASWCTPCRNENPEHVDVYKTYKDSVFSSGSSFTIFSISLDMENGKNAWLSAIAKDSLIWPYHVSEFKGWKGKISKKYDVKFLPANFLIDGNGVIIAKNLRHEHLPDTLNSILAKNKPQGNKIQDAPLPRSERKNPPAEKKENPQQTSAGILNEKRRYGNNFLC